MEIIKEKITKDWKFFSIIMIVILAIIMMSFYAVGISDKLYKTSDKIEVKDYIHNIECGNIIEQKIIAKEDNFQRVDIQFEPLKEETNVAGKVSINIKDENGKVIKEERITRNNIRENPIYEFGFKKQKNSQGKEYTLELKFEQIEEGKQFFSVKLDKNSEIINELIINGQEQEGKLAIQEFYLNTTKQAFFIGIVAVFTIYALGISTYIFYKKDIKTEKIFLFTVPVICLFYILCMPTFKNHDELYHWYRAYEVSIGKLATGIDGDILGTNMPENIVKPLTDDWTKNISNIYKSN